MKKFWLEMWIAFWAVCVLVTYGLYAVLLMAVAHISPYVIETLFLPLHNPVPAFLLRVLFSFWTWYLMYLSVHYFGWGCLVLIGCSFVRIKINNPLRLR